MIYLILVLVCISLFIDHFIWAFTIGGGKSFWSMWKERIQSFFNTIILNAKFKRNLQNYQSQFSNKELFYYGEKGSIYSEDFLSIDLYFKDKVISFTYFYNPYDENPYQDNCTVVNLVDFNNLRTQTDYGSQINLYLKMLSHSKEIEKNSSLIIDKMLEQESSLDFQEHFLIHRSKLVQQLQNELNK